MPANRRTPWLVCYDIADPDRLRQVHKEVRRYAAPFQYSVFRTQATRGEMVRRLDLLAHIIDPRHDDIRAYPLLTTFEPVIYGRPLLASGLHLAWREEFFDNQKIQAADTELAACALTPVRNMPRNVLKMRS